VVQVEQVVQVVHDEKVVQGVVMVVIGLCQIF